MTSGRIEDYYWYDLDELAMRVLVALVKPHIIGLNAINTSWDSGILTPTEEELLHGWTMHGLAGVSPEINDVLVSSWPISHDDFCDEWWFFHNIPVDFDVTHGLCNMVGNRIADWGQLEFDGCVELARNIRRFRPELIIGNNEWAYCISRCPLKELGART